LRTLHIITGPPGAGKTTFGRELAAKKQATFIDIDTSTETMVKAALHAMERNPDDRDSPFFKTNFRDPIYETLFTIAKDNLPHNDVIITGPFTKEKKNADWIDELADRFKTYYIHCSTEERRKRLLNRGNPRDRDKLEDWNSFLKYYGDESPPAYPHTFVRSSSS